MSSVLNDDYDCDIAYSIIFSFTLKNKKKISGKFLNQQKSDHFLFCLPIPAQCFRCVYFNSFDNGF